MEYIDVLWMHSSQLEPIRLLSELGEDRFETRKIEFFPGGSIGYAAKDISINGTMLGEVAVPDLATINSDPQFQGKRISKQEFEDFWCDMSPQTNFK